MSFSRRSFLKSTLAASSVVMAQNILGAASAKDVQLSFGAERNFSFEVLKKRAQDMASQIYLSPSKPSPDVVKAIDYDAHGKLKFKPDLSLFMGQDNASPVTFFHLGRFFAKKVTINVLEDGKAREILYSDSYFDMPEGSPAHKLGQDSGFAGFRFQEPQTRNDWRTQDWAAFLGASYFRAIGDLGQYGLSARGVAVNVAVADKPEEFPDFREFWIETPQGGEATGAVYALLDGPSITGAFKFTFTRNSGVEMSVEQYLFVRKPIDLLGIAPLTSMYWFSETKRPELVDWRPEVHDSDGLQMWTGSGERIWRPLNNPPRTAASAFIDSNPHGFGVMQRDRNFDHYLDGVNYDKRPSLWVEPIEAWGEGSVHLVEIPTDSEIHDNIVAMWVPKLPARVGASYAFKYKLYWQNEEPSPINLGRVVATRLGQGGQLGYDHIKGVRKFVVEFKGEALTKIPMNVKPDAIISCSRGDIGPTYVEAVPDDVKGHWRAVFDLNVSGEDPVELRCFLQLGDELLTETWAYQYQPIRDA